MKTISNHFKSIIEEGIKESRWFVSSPAEFKNTAKIKIIGVENHKFYGLGTSGIRPALIAECNCGGEIQRFSLLLDNTTTIEAIG